MKKISSGYSSDSEQNNKQDLSILRKPITTGLTGFLEAKRAYDNGTEEIRRILTRECDILYECKVCRNMFRSFTNFISHKRVYCRTAFSNLSNHFNINNGSIDVATIIQKEQDFVNHSTTNDNKNTENSNKDLSSIVERLLKREQANSVMKLSDYYDQVNNKLTQDELLRKKHEIQLDRVPNSNVAVYQTIKRENCDNIKKEVTEVNDLIHKRTVIGSDGKVIVNDKKVVKNNSVESRFKENKKNIDSEEVSCDVCNLKFLTEKTLKLHLQTKHISTTFVYQCPSCSQTFLQPHAVFRHLSNDHKKSLRRIRLMRDSILKRCVRIDEVQTRGPSRELARLQTDNEKRHAENKAWMNKSDLSNSSPMCAYCGKTFERKAVLTTHLNNCPMKNKCPGPQTRRFTEMANSTSNCRNGNDQPRTPSILNGYDLNELRDIKELDLNNPDEYMSLSGAPSRDGSPVNKRKRKRTCKVLQGADSMADASESLNELFWSINNSSENMALKTVSLHKSPSSTPPPDTKSDSQKQDQIVEKNDKSPESESALKSHKQVSFYCRICVKKFDVLSNLRRHISMFHYRKRKFGCKLCDYRAFRKYDVINHLNSNHSITGEREEVLHYVIVKESKGERNEENIDADVIIDENGTLDVEVSPKNVEKRRRRTKVKEPSKSPAESPPRETPVNTEVKNESKFTRTPSNLSLSSNEEGSSSSLSKRPIRNRVKPVNKDFVYDLSNLLKKDMVLSEKTQRRRNTQCFLDDSSRDSTTPPTLSNGDTSPQAETTEVPRNPNINPNIKGAALIMAHAAVSSFSACFHKPPELPAERPSIITRIVPAVTDSKSSEWSLLKPPESRRSSDDNIFQSVGKKRRQDASTNSNANTKTASSISEILPPKIEININGDSKVKLVSDRTQDEGSDSEKIIVKLFSTEKEFKERLVANKLTDPGTTSPNPAFIDSTKLPSSSSAAATNGIGSSSQSQRSVIQSSGVPLPPTKRIAMLERLVENKKIRGSFLKLS